VTLELARVNELCSEAVEISFHALAPGNQPPAYDTRQPFRGLSPFRTEDREFFFGRDGLVEKLLQKLSVILSPLINLAVEVFVERILFPFALGLFLLIASQISPALRRQFFLRRSSDMRIRGYVVLPLVGGADGRPSVCTSASICPRYLAYSGEPCGS
jgi:hypothetical protein